MKRIKDRSEKGWNNMRNHKQKFFNFAIICLFLMSITLYFTNIAFADEPAPPSTTQEEMDDPENQADAADAAAASAQASANEWADTYPFSNPNALSQIASQTVQAVADEPNRELFAFRLGQQSKMPIVLRIISIVQKYKQQIGEDGNAEPSQFDQMLEQFNEQNKEIAESAKEFSNGGEGDALPYIAGLLGVQVRQLALNNTVLIELNRTILSEIQLLEHIAYMDIETYRSNISGSLASAFNIYEKILSPTH